MADREDVCGVCGETRENHGDMNHVFDVEGQLKRKEAAGPPRQAPPEMAGTTAQMTQNAFLRLIEVLVNKGLLDGEDLVRVFGGDSSNRRPAASSTGDAS